MSDDREQREGTPDAAPSSASKPHRWNVPVSASGQPVCDLCGHPMRESHCKLICDQCGYVRDCSDP